ncbi:MAG: P1 family peptidase [Anaerolineaceae bacterium]|nr:P1 family peptidase [Anaerolineaceae bacterium]
MKPYTFQKTLTDSITDISGVRVGHCSLLEGRARTGVTAIIPAAGNLFRSKLIAAAHVINGFGKSSGLMQVNELGCLETPIILTNTLSVGAAWDGLVRYMMELEPGIGRGLGSVNPVVGECNDGSINDIRCLAVKPEHVLAALGAASSLFLRGSVGAGTGMICYGMKGGIGSAAYSIAFGSETYQLGALVLSNFGKPGALLMHGQSVPEKMQKAVLAQVERLNLENDSIAGEGFKDKGSIMVVIATDAPFTHRQLARIARRAQNGIAQTGSYTGGQSGDVVIAFSTAQRITLAEEQNESDEIVLNLKCLREECLDAFFEACTLSVRDAILDSIVQATSIQTANGMRFLSYCDLLKLK